MKASLHTNINDIEYEELFLSLLQQIHRRKI